jgi:hypothetical protein
VTVKTDRNKRTPPTGGVLLHESRWSPAKTTIKNKLIDKMETSMYTFINKLFVSMVRERELCQVKFAPCNFVQGKLF